MSFDDLKLESTSGYQIGEEGPLILIVQSVIGVKETGVWSVEDEAVYQTYVEKQNWKILREILNSGTLVPTFWDVGVIDAEDKLNFEF